ncbi:unnamed protein product [Phytomonas sp. Hart1]|nr:unnamed protein product [Phytomonas sp. Hart1]|eukprot:CCW66518.1 unnamed protein product [Phytomonas sp. isolate Hart1]
MVESSDDVGSEFIAQVMRQLSEIDGLLQDEMTSSDDDTALLSDLEDDTNISARLARSNHELRVLSEEFLQDHLDHADPICGVYHDLSRSEAQLVDFETAIVAFQRELERTSGDMRAVQERIGQIALRVAHRRGVSAKIHDVCNALQACDTFCEAIVHREVDQEYLRNLRELEQSLAFLSCKELQASRLDNEIRPKLVAAALKAGNKLQRFLTKQILALVGDPDNLESNQQVLEQNGHLAYRFLSLYNAPVAEEIVKLYVNNMSSMYRKQLEALLRGFAEASELRGCPLDPIVLSAEITAILSNHDAGSPAGNQVEVPSQNGFPARVLTPKERRASRHLLNLTNIFTKSDTFHGFREATFQDTVAVVRSLEVRHGRLQNVQGSAEQLDQCDCWVWQLVKFLAALANICMTECRFIDSFFSFPSESDGEEHLHTTERLAHAVLDSTIRAVEFSIKEYSHLVLDRTDVLAALRCVDIVKQYLCTMQDPIPLLMLSGMLEMSKSIFKGNLRIALHNDRVALGYLSSMKLSGFHQVLTLSAKMLSKLLYEPDYAVTLGPHPTLMRVGELLGELELLNTAPFFRFYFVKEDESCRTYDTHVSAFIATSLINVLDFVEQLAKRHPSALSQSFFSCCNILCIYNTWRKLISEFEQKDLESTRFNACDSLTWRSTYTTHFVSSCSNSDTLVISDVAPPYFSDSKNAKFLEGRFEKALEMLVAAYIENQNNFDYYFKFNKNMEMELGEDFFSVENQQNIASEEFLEKNPCSKLTAAKTFEIATTFNCQWHDQFYKVVADITQAAQAIFKGVSSSTHSRPASQYLCSEFVYTIMRVYCNALVRANDRLSIFVTKIYAKKSNIQSKLISSSVLIGEMQKIIRRDME